MKKKKKGKRRLFSRARSPGLFASPFDSGPRSGTKSYARPVDREHAPARSAPGANSGPERAATLPASHSEQSRARERAGSLDDATADAAARRLSLLTSSEDAAELSRRQNSFSSAQFFPSVLDGSDPARSRAREAWTGRTAEKSPRAGKRGGGERSAGGSANRKAIDDHLSLLSRDEAAASRRSLRLSSLPQK